MIKVVEQATRLYLPDQVNYHYLLHFKWLSSLDVAHFASLLEHFCFNHLNIFTDATHLSDLVGLIGVKLSSLNQLGKSDPTE